MNQDILNRPASIKLGERVAFLVWACIMSAAILFYINWFVLSLDFYLWAAILVFICATPFLIGALKKNFIPYEAHYIFSLGILTSFCSYLFLPLGKIWLDFNSIASALKLPALGMVAFLFGYYSVLGKAAAKGLPLKQFVITGPVLRSIPAKLYFVGWMLRSLPYISERSIGMFEKVGLGLPIRILNTMSGWELLNMFTTYGICVALMLDTYMFFLPSNRVYMDKRTRKKISLRLTLFFLAEILSGFYSGVAGNIIKPIIFMAFAYIKARKKIPFIPIILIFAFFLLYCAPFIKAVRNSYWAGSAANFAATAKEYFSDKENLSADRDNIIRRLADSLQMAIVCIEARKEGKQIIIFNGLPEYVSRFLPRFLWPGKPRIDYNELGKKLGIVDPSDYNTSIGLTFIGGLIIDGGATGVAIGLFIAGVLLRMFWYWLMVRSDENIFAFAIYAVLINRFVFPDDFYSIIHSCAAFLVYTYLLSGFINRKYDKEQAINNICAASAGR